MARFVLVHGAFGGAWTWEPIVDKLESLGHTVETFDLPGGGTDETPLEDVTLASCADRVCSVLAQRPEAAVLVGYSMGGIVATQAAGNCPERFASLIFVASFMPSNGQSLLDLTGLPEGEGDMIQANIVIEGEPPVASMSAEATATAVYNCCPPHAVERAVARRRPQAVAVFATPVQADDSVLDAIPRSYILTGQDNCIMPTLQRRMVAEHPCKEVVELDTDHAPQLSMTDDVVAALDSFAR